MAVSDTDDRTSPGLRLAIRTMGALRAEKPIDYLCDSLQGVSSARIRIRIVGKTAALCVVKLYDFKPELVLENGFLEYLLREQRPRAAKRINKYVIWFFRGACALVSHTYNWTEYASEVHIDFIRKMIKAIGQPTDVHVLCISIDVRWRHPPPPLFTNLEELDKPETKALLIWIIDKYANRIDNADGLLGIFVDSFIDSSAPDARPRHGFENVFRGLCDGYRIRRRKTASDPVSATARISTGGFSSNPWDRKEAAVLAHRPTIDPTPNDGAGLLEELMDDSSPVNVYYKPEETFVAARYSQLHKLRTTNLAGRQRPPLDWIRDKESSSVERLQETIGAVDETERWDHYNATVRLVIHPRGRNAGFSVVRPDVQVARDWQALIKRIRLTVEVTLQVQVGGDHGNQATPQRSGGMRERRDRIEDEDNDPIFDASDPGPALHGECSGERRGGDTDRIDDASDAGPAHRGERNAPNAGRQTHCSHHGCSTERSFVQGPIQRENLMNTAKGRCDNKVRNSGCGVVYEKWREYSVQSLKWEVSIQGKQGLSGRSMLLQVARMTFRHQGGEPCMTLVRNGAMLQSRGSRSSCASIHSSTRVDCLPGFEG
ncbi:hypothetical protein B0H12DRAFT_1219972 [Mycena haematopus]|nr:hypothetical protein B0H12DRAFT_1219972 [Mycena haematopus]